MNIDLRALAAELAQVMRDANTPDAWDVTRGLGPNFVPFDHFAEVALAWMRAAVLPAHRRLVLGGAAAVVETIYVSRRYLNEGDRVKADAIAALRRLAETGPPTPPSATESVQDGPAVPEVAAEAQRPAERACPAHGTHPHNGRRCLDCPQCVGVEAALDVDALKRLCDEATGGPWIARENSDGQSIVSTPEGRSAAVSIEVASHDGGWLIALDRQRADAEFIAAARTAVPWLLARVADLEAERDEARENEANAFHNLNRFARDRDRLARHAEQLETDRNLLAAQRDRLAEERDAAVSVFELAEGALTEALDERDQLRAHLAQFHGQPGTPDDPQALRRRVEREQAEQAVLEHAKIWRYVVKGGYYGPLENAVDALAAFESADGVVSEPKADPREDDRG